VTAVVHRLPPVSERVAPPLNVGVFPFAALLDNVRSTFNVGSIFRSADGAGLHHLYLCGVTPTPAHPKLAKTALGAERTVSYSHHKNAIELGQRLYDYNHTLWALETTASALSIFDVEPPPLPFVLVVGSEVVGVDPDLLKLCQRCISIPMVGRKQSLNVATAFGIAAVLLRRRIEAG
jgi:tRNA G18 (ribose-2'-O)-methylase SpoU